MPTATVQVRQTTTTTTARSSVIVINTGYLSSKLGLLKFLILVFSLIAFIMMLMAMDEYRQSFDKNIDSDRFLLITAFADWLTVTLMLLAALLSLGSATILPKASFDFIFHFCLGILMLIGGIWVATTAFGDPQRDTYTQAGCICAAVCGLIQIIHGIFSYRLCVTN